MEGWLCPALSRYFKVAPLATLTFQNMLQMSQVEFGDPSRLYAGGIEV